MPWLYNPAKISKHGVILAFKLKSFDASHNVDR